MAHYKINAFEFYNSLPRNSIQFHVKSTCILFPEPKFCRHILRSQIYLKISVYEHEKQFFSLDL
jgi:hypothetical protein